MKHASTRMIFSYWDALRGERAAPDRGEIEPGEIRHVLADTFLLEIGPGGAVEFRLAGTRLCALFGRELKGGGFARLWPPYGAPEVGRLIEIVADETAGLVAGLVGATDEDDAVDLEMILLPLRHRGRPHARILGAMSPAAVPPWIGFRPVRELTTTSLRVIRPPVRAAPGSGADASLDERRRRFVVHQGGRS